MNNCKAATAGNAKYTDDISEVVVPHVKPENDYAVDSGKEQIHPKKQINSLRLDHFCQFPIVPLRQTNNKLSQCLKFL